MSQPRLVDIQATARNPKFQTIPNRIVPADTRWYEMPERLSRAGADTYTWELASCMAQMFDTYGDEIKQLEVSWSTTTSRDQLFLQARVLINNCDACLGWDMNGGGDESISESVEVAGLSDMVSRLRDNDQCRALEAFHHSAEDAPQPLTMQIELLNSRFRCVRSAEHARAIVASINPQVLAEISQMEMVMDTNPAAPSEQRPPMRM